MKGGRGRNGRRALLERSDLITGKRTKRTKVEQAEPFRQARAGSPRPAEAGRNKFALNEPGSSKARPGSAPITSHNAYENTSVVAPQDVDSIVYLYLCV